MKTALRTYSPGEFLMHQNENSRHLFVIQKGKVLIFRKDGNYVTFTKEAKKGELVGALSLIDGQPRNTSARCETEVTAAIISPQEFDTINKNIPTWLKALTRSLAHRMRKAIERTERNANFYVRTSIISLFIYYGHSQGEDVPFVRDEITKEFSEILRAHYNKVEIHIEDLIKLGYLKESRDKISIKSLKMLDQLLLSMHEDFTH